MRYVYPLDRRHGLGSAELIALIGGKAAGLAVMATELGLPVPRGFVITTVACKAYLGTGWPAGLDDEIRAELRRLENAVGCRLGEPEDPLLVSVRSGAPVSMPGMMDTILNLGLNDATTKGLAAASGDPIFAVDCQRRFQTMFNEIVGVAPSTDAWEQLRMAIEAVFRSWNSERALAYRKRESILDDLGTAVTIQTMVFGNRGSNSAAGVLFTRNPATGEPSLYGDVLFSAQGEDVVAGTHRPEPIAVLDTRMPAVARELRGYADVLERHFGDMCDIEFTIDRGTLWLLQVRVGKRTPQAAVRIAVDMAEAANFPLTRAEAVERVAPLLLHPPAVPSSRRRGIPALAAGLGASPGVATGVIATTSAAALEAADSGRPVILVRAETSPEDVQGMAKAAGVLTARGGLASHAAVVARGWGIPAIVGAAALEVGDATITVAGRTLMAGDVISIDGSTGEIFAGEVANRRTVAPEVRTLLGWAAERGIQIGEPESSADSAPGGAFVKFNANDAIRSLYIKGSGTVESLASALMSPLPLVQTTVSQLAAEGLVERSGATQRLTAAGRRLGKELLADDQAKWGLSSARAALDAFRPLDRRLKQTVTAWQLRDQNGSHTLNDHNDSAYDSRVLSQLADLHRESSLWLASMSGALARFGTYAQRLQRAADLAGEGDAKFVASPTVDSYHGIWFELHEDLIRLSGRSRTEEADVEPSQL